jgi:hypothetical protein
VLEYSYNINYIRDNNMTRKRSNAFHLDNGFVDPELRLLLNTIIAAATNPPQAPSPPQAPRLRPITPREMLIIFSSKKSSDPISFETPPASPRGCKDPSSKRGKFNDEDDKDKDHFSPAKPILQQPFRL